MVKLAPRDQAAFRRVATRQPPAAGSPVAAQSASNLCWWAMRSPAPKNARTHVRAVSLSAGGTGEAFESEVVDDREPTPARHADDYIVDPDPANPRRRSDGGLRVCNTAYARSADRPASSPARHDRRPADLPSPPRVLWQGAWDRRRIRRQLGELGAALTSVKSPAAFRSTLRRYGKNLNRGGRPPPSRFGSPAPVGAPTRRSQSLDRRAGRSRCGRTLRLRKRPPGIVKQGDGGADGSSDASPR